MKENNPDKPGTLPISTLIAAHKQNLARKIMNGETNLTKELVYLEDLEARQEKRKPQDENTDTDPGIGVPERLRVHRRYTMSPAARDARRKGGKARAKTNPAPNWKHGKYARSAITSMKPCKTTCDKYPCELIGENRVRPGDACLDMVNVVQTYESIIKAVKNKEYDDFNEISAFQISQSIEVLRMCLEDIIRDGTMVKSEKMNTEGKVIGYEIKPHPSLLVVPKLLAELGMTPQEAMITPRQIAKQGAEEEGAQTIADLIGSIGKLNK